MRTGVSVRRAVRPAPPARRSPVRRRPAGPRCRSPRGRRRRRSSSARTSPSRTAVNQASTMRRPRSRSGRCGLSAPRTLAAPAGCRAAAGERSSTSAISSNERRTRRAARRDALRGAECLQQHEQRHAHLIAPSHEFGRVHLHCGGLVTTARPATSARASGAERAAGRGSHAETTWSATPRGCRCRRHPRVPGGAGLLHRIIGVRGGAGSRVAIARSQGRWSRTAGRAVFDPSCHISSWSFVVMSTRERPRL